MTIHCKSMGVVLEESASLATTISPLRSIRASTTSMDLLPIGWQLTYRMTRSLKTPKWILCHSLVKTCFTSQDKVCKVRSYFNMDNSTVFRAGFRATANCGLPRESVIRMTCHRLLGSRLVRKVVTKPNCSGNPWSNTRWVGILKLAVESIR